LEGTGAGNCFQPIFFSIKKLEIASEIASSPFFFHQEATFDATGR